MSNKFIPNSFQVPNAVVDELMDDLKDVEFRCYITLIRQTTGWNKQFDFISVSQFQKFTGRGKTAIIAAMKTLQTLGLVVELEQTKNGVKCYALNMDKLTEWGSESELEAVQKVNGSKSEPVQKVNWGGSESELEAVQKVNTQNTNNKTHSTKNNITRLDGTKTDFSNLPENEKTKTSPSEKSTKPNAKNLLAEFGITDQLADDYIAHRKAKRASISKTVLQNLAAEAAKANMTISQAIEYQIAQGWQGFSAEWILNKMGLTAEKSSGKSSVNHVAKHTNGGFQSW